MLQFVSPYSYEFKAYTKARWVGKPLLCTLAHEFKRSSKAYFERAIIFGAIKVNGKKVCPLYLLKENDLITHFVHRHEPPIPKKKIEVLFENASIIAVDKPSGLPCHPNSSYNKNSLTEILKEKEHLSFLSAINRLDKQTSGVVLLAKSPRVAAEYHKKISEESIEKMYLCKVKGYFPKDLVYVDLPLSISRSTCITTIYDKNISEGKKESQTLFLCISQNEDAKESLLLCRPLTGRTHQIRVHLQAIGYPISNDLVYSKGYIPEKKIELFRKKDIIVVNEDGFAAYLLSVGVTLQKEKKHPFFEEEVHIDNLAGIDLLAEEESKLSIEDFASKTCMLCNNTEKAERPPRFTSIFLHALQYSIDKDSFTASVPEWASITKEALFKKVEGLKKAVQQNNFYESAYKANECTKKGN